MNRISIITKRIACLFFGHKEDCNDSGYNVCSRCEMHEYYDHDYYIQYGLIHHVHYRLKDLWKYQVYRRCEGCGCILKLCGVPLEKCKDGCLPF